MIQYDSKIQKNYIFLVRFYIELLIKKDYNNDNKYLGAKINKIMGKVIRNGNTYFFDYNCINKWNYNISSG